MARRCFYGSDIEKETQEQIVQMYPDLKVDVMVLPHHGSENTRSTTFVEKLSPAVLLCSCAQTQFQKYSPDENANSKSFYTARDGEVTVRIDKSGNITTSSLMK
jgi:beta-lactamase superfamily II metal-dependent hydrolase